jgi:hypothetical protein
MSQILNISVRSHRLARIPLRSVDLSGCLDTGLEALLRVGYAISSYAWIDTDPDAHTVASHRIAYLRLQFPHLLPPGAIHDWDSRLPMGVRTISPELLNVTFPEGSYLILASPPALATHLSKSNREHTSPSLDIVKHILRLVLHLSESQPEGIRYI